MTLTLPVNARFTITKPGVYNIPADQYHLDPVEGGSLSSTGARKLLDPSCPALFKHWQDHPEEHKRTFDFGQAAHAELLGIGRPIRVIDHPDFKTKAAREARDNAYVEDEIPLLAHEYEVVKAMIAQIRAHPVAGALFDPDNGVGEQTIVWRDRRTGVACRAMLDWLPHCGDGRLIVPDYKTTARAVDPRSLSRTLADFGLHQQGAWYLDAVHAANLTGELDPAFVLVFQSKTPPFLVNVVQVDPHALMWGDVLNQEARATYAHCTATGYWPGYDQVTSIDLPGYTVRQLEDAREAGDLTRYSDRKQAAA